MNKKKRKLLVVLMLGLALTFTVSVPAVSAAEKTDPMAAALSIDAPGTLDLFPNGNGIASIQNVFGYWTENEKYFIFSSERGTSETELYHSMQISKPSTGTGELFANIELGENLVRASKNGYLTVSASAQVSRAEKGQKALMYLENGTYEGTARGGVSNIGESVSASTTSKDFQEMNLKLERALTGNGLVLRFFADSNGAWTGKSQVKAMTPSVKIETTDKAVPVIGDLSVDHEGWYNGAKTLTVPVTDSEAGVAALIVNGERLAPVSVENGTKTASFEVPVPANGDYTLQAVDNVGNLGEARIYSETKIDLSAPAAPIVTVAGGWHHENDVRIDVAFSEENPQSPVKLVWTSDGSEPSFQSSELAVGENTVTFDNGEYLFRVAAIDEAGNRSEIRDFPLNVDSTVYSVETGVTQDGGEITSSLTAMRGDRVTIAYRINEGWSFHRLLVGGVETVDAGGVLEFEVENHIIVELKLRKNLVLTLDRSDYTYTGEPIAPEYSANIPLSAITFVSTLASTGEFAEILNAGGYVVNYSVDNEQYIGSGSLTVTVSKQILSLETVSDSEIFDGTEKNVIVKNPADGVTYRIIMDEAIRAGEYPYSIVVDDPNFEGERNGVFTVERRKITVTALAKSSVYGDPLAALELEIANAASEALNFELVCELFGAGASAVPPAGNYSISIVRNDLSDYEITYRDGSYVVERRKVTVTADEGQFKNFGDSDPEHLRYSVSSECSGGMDPLVVHLTRESGERAGNYAISIQESYVSDNPNYDMEYLGTDFSIVGKKLVIMAIDVVTEYGTETEIPYRLVSGEGAELTGSLGREPGNGVGRYEINLGTLGNPAYEITFFSATYEIVPKKIEVRAEESGKIYGDPDGELRWESDGLVAGDTLSGVLAREAGESVGRYSISVGTLANANYEITFVPATFAISRRALTVTAAEHSKVYGERDGELRYAASGLIEGDALAGSLGRAEGETVGRYAISIGTLANSNYEIMFVSANFTVEKRTLLLTAAAGQGKTYGEADGELMLNAEGLLEGDSHGGRLVREGGEAAGDYAMKLEGELNPNYEVSFETNVYTIAKADFVLGLEDFSVDFSGEAVTEFASNKLDFMELTFEIKKLGSIVSEAVDAGVYTLTASFAGNENYNPAVSNRAVLTIEKKSVFFTVSQDRFVYDGTEKLPAFVSDNEEVGVTVVFEGLDGTPVEPGSYPFTITTSEADENYSGEYKGVLTIVPVPKFDTENSSVTYLSGAPIAGTFEIKVSSEQDVLKSANTTLEANEKKRNVLAQIELIYSGDSLGSLVEVKIAFSNAENYKNIKLYAVSEDGGVRTVKAEVVDGYLVFQTDDASARFVMTEDRSSNWGLWVATGGGGLAAVGGAAFILLKWKTKVI